MATAGAEVSAKTFSVDPELLKATQDAVANALAMCQCNARCVGVSSVPAHETGTITGLIGVHGKVSGFLTLNLSERFAVKAINGLLQDNYKELTAQVVDGVGELTNIVVGGIKSALSNTRLAFPHITVPSVIVGSGYKIAYAKGLDFMCAVFEQDDEEAIMLNDRLMQVSISLLRL